MATKLHGRIVAADSTEKTITIQCDSKISGVTMGEPAIIEFDLQHFPVKNKMDPDDLIHTGEIHSEDEEWK